MTIHYILKRLKALYMIILIFLGFHQLIPAGANDHIVYESVVKAEIIEKFEDIRFSEEVKYGESADVMFGNILSATVGPDGKVYLGDNDQRKIHVLDANGSYITSFGSHGNGPGEFQMINKIKVNDEFVHAFDMIQARIHLYDPVQYRFVRTVSLLENDSRGQPRMSPGQGRPFDFF